ncbi:MAG: pirin family protein [Holophagaceae bacterium]|nr:pirin family protein [Holophagaceae bacterium]
MKMREVKTLIHGQPTTDGNKVPLVRLLPGAGMRGSEAFQLMDPFLLMDHFGPMVLSPGTDAGFPPHPHRGFQTLTYMMQGAFRHRDSTGGQGLLEPGGAQLMNAGSGIVHEEMPVPEHLETGGPIEGVQLWINLPKSEKGSQPGYTDLHAAMMPWQAFEGGRLRALAGEWLGRTGPAETPAKIAYAHIELEAGSRFEHSIPGGFLAAVALLHGDVVVSGQNLRPDDVAVFGEKGEAIRVESAQGASLMVLAGLPLKEPIAHYGPFVMNTPEEIQQAFDDYQSGKMGFLG